MKQCQKGTKHGYASKHGGKTDTGMTSNKQQAKEQNEPQRERLELINEPLPLPLPLPLLLDTIQD